MSNDSNTLAQQFRAVTAERDALKLVVEELGAELTKHGIASPAIKSESRGPSMQFDREWYLDTYPDVVSLGMDPEQHYEWIGRKLGRAPNAGMVKKNVNSAGFWRIHR